MQPYYVLNLVWPLESFESEALLVTAPSPEVAARQVAEFESLLDGARVDVLVADNRKGVGGVIYRITQRVSVTYHVAAQPSDSANPSKA